MARIQLKTLEDAEDVVGDTFIKLLEVDREFESEGEAQAYISKTLYHAIINFRRREGAGIRGGRVGKISIVKAFFQD